MRRTIGGLVVAFVLGVLFSFALAPADFLGQPIVVNFDPGGGVSQENRWIERLAHSGTQVRIEGSCISACTLLLQLPPSQVCMTPNASFGFHLATDNGIPDPNLTKLLEKAFYPAAVREWIGENGPLKQMPIFMSADTAIGLGVVHKC